MSLLSKADLKQLCELSYNMQQQRQQHPHQQMFVHENFAAPAFMDPVINMNMGMPRNIVPQLPMNMSMRNSHDMPLQVPMPVPMNMNINMNTVHRNVNMNVPAARLFASDLGLREYRSNQLHNAVLPNSSSNMVELPAPIPMELSIQGQSSSNAVPLRRTVLNNGSQEQLMSMENRAPQESSKLKPHGKNIQEEAGNSQSVNENGKEQNEAAAEKSTKKERTMGFVRAKRGIATDSHSTTERARRYSQRFNYLTSLVSTCEMVKGRVAILDEIINYIQCLQRLEQSLQIKLQKLTEQLLQAQAMQQNRQLQQGYQSQLCGTYATSCAQCSCLGYPLLGHELSGLRGDHGNQ